MRYLYRQRKGDVGKKSEVLVMVLGAKGGHTLLVGDHASDALALSARKGRTGAGVRHVVISAESDSGDVVQRLKQAAKDWIKKYAPGRSWVAVVHSSERGHPHIHIAVEHRGDDKRGLKWSRKDVRAMSSMAFTAQFENSYKVIEGQTKSSKRSKVYPHAVDLDALVLVRRIIESGMDLDSYITSMRMGVGKVDSSGKPWAVLFAGRRIRVATLRRLFGIEMAKRKQAKLFASLTVRNALAPPLRPKGLFAQLDDVTNCLNKPRER